MVKLIETLPCVRGMMVLDAGCGEGKNAQYFDQNGATVTAVDCSMKALTNARAKWPSDRTTWIEGDIRTLRLGGQPYDVVIAYGLLHCLSDRDDVEATANLLKRVTKPSGYNVICTFNARSQNLREAHSGFHPCLLPHKFFLKQYDGWYIEAVSDEDLTETHPHNSIVHTHSMTRLIARKPK